jgi:hypothetical protein
MATTPAKTTDNTLNYRTIPGSHCVHLWSAGDSTVADTDTASNIGVDTYSPYTVGDGYYNGAGLSRTTTGDWSPFVTCGAGVGSVVLWQPAATETWPEATIVAVFRNRDDGGDTIIWNNRLGPATTGHLDVQYVTADGHLYIRLNYGSGNTAVDVGAVVDNTWYVVVVRAGVRYGKCECWLRALDSSTVAYGYHAQSQGPGFETGTGRNPACCCSLTGAGDGDTDLSLTGTINIAVCDRDIQALLADPYILDRAAPSTDYFSTYHGRQGRVTSTGASIAATTGTTPYASFPTDARGIRFRYGTDPYNLSSTSDGIIGTVDQQYGRLIAVASGLTPNTEYWIRPEHSEDNGSTWVPFPMPLGYIKTSPPNLTDVDVDVVFTSDSHTGASLTCDNTQGYGARLVGKIGDDKHWNSFRVMEYIYENKTPLWFDLGDHHYTDSETTGSDTVLDANSAGNCREAVYRATVVENFWALANITGSGNRLKGNHEKDEGWLDYDSGSAFSFARHYAFKNTVLNPQYGTYTFDAQNETGDVTHEVLSWMPPETSPFTDYPGGGYSKLVETFYDDTHGINDHNRENYFGVSWGNLGVLCLDPYRYTWTGITSGSWPSTMGSSPSEWTLGAGQTLWLSYQLRNLTRFKYRVVVMHQAFNGYPGNTYGRHQLYEFLPGTYMYALHQLFKTYGVQLVVTGHNHVYTHSVVNGVNYCNCPSSGTAFSLSSDWGTRASYGASLGEANYKFMAMVNGFLKLEVRAAQMTVKFVATHFKTGNALSGDTMAQSEELMGAVTWNGSAWEPVTYTVDGSDQITLPVTPKHVAFAIKDTDYDDTWAGSQAPDKRGTPPGDYAYMPAYSSGTIALDASVAAADEIICTYTPMEVHSFTISASSGAEGPSGVVWLPRFGWGTNPGKTLSYPGTSRVY